MPETREEKIARIKAAERGAAEEDAKIQSLRDELGQQGCIYADLAGQVFEKDLKHLSIKDGLVIGARELVIKHREDFPEAFRGPNPKFGGTPPPRESPRGESVIEARSRESRYQAAIAKIKISPTFGRRPARM